MTTGLIFMENTGEGMRKVDRLLHKYMKHYNIPICFDFPIGHAHLRNFPLFTGAKATLEVTKESVILHFFRQ